MCVCECVWVCSCSLTCPGKVQQTSKQFPSHLLQIFFLILFYFFFQFDEQMVGAITELVLSSSSRRAFTAGGQDLVLENVTQTGWLLLAPISNYSTKDTKSKWTTCLLAGTDISLRWNFSVLVDYNQKIFKYLGLILIGPIFLSNISKMFCVCRKWQPYSQCSTSSYISKSQMWLFKIHWRVRRLSSTSKLGQETASQGCGGDL